MKWKLILCSPIIFSFVTSCGLLGLKGKKSSNSSRSPFVFEASSAECKDSSGRRGQNNGLVECGRVENQSLDGQDLSGRNLRGIMMDNVTLKDANLSEIDFTGANMSEVDFSSANLSNANLSQIYFSLCSFTNADLRGAIFLDPTANVLSALAYGTDLTGAKINFRTIMPGSIEKLIDVEGVEFDGYSESNPDSFRGMSVASKPGYLSSISNAESSLLFETLKGSSELVFDASSDERFTSAFGGGSINDLLDFASRNISHLYRGVSSSSSTVAANRSSNVLASVFNNRADKGLTTYNLVDFYFLGDEIDIDSTDIKPVTLENRFFSMIGASHISRLGTLAHEAMHSICPEAPQDTERLDKIISGDVKSEDYTQEELRCFHSHVKCPEGHDLAGEDACDNHKWGAYAIGMTVAEAFKDHCENCNDLEKEVARMKGIDQRSRILVLEEMLNDGSTFDTSPSTLK